MNAARDIIEGLRGRIREIEGRRPTREAFVASGWVEVDRLLPGGGFPRGAVSELIGTHASGKTAIALSTVAGATRDRGVAAFVDGRHELYPPAAAALGVDLDRLLVVRPDRTSPAEATRVGLWTAEALLASGAFEAVAIDVPIEGTPASAMAPASLDLMLRRVRAAAEKGGAAALWLAEPGGVRCASAVRLECSRAPGGWLVRRTHARGLEERAGDRDAANGGVAEVIAPVHHAA
jgi:protein ImuA